jgi:hypothetical protein
MIYNENLKSSYGEFPEIGKPSKMLTRRTAPSPEEYENGYITRFFAKKINENVIMEIDFESYSRINTALYKGVQIEWKITGPRNNIMLNGRFDKAGVTEQNTFEIDRIKKEEGVDLSSVLANKLEYWRGN